MFFAVLRHTIDNKLPPALLQATEWESFTKGLIEHKKKGWEVVFAAQGERINLEDLPLLGKSKL